MTRTRQRSRDVWAGLMFLGTGIAAVTIARGYTFGTTLRMGPGYFPTILGGLLVVFGLVLVGRGMRRAEAIPGGWSLRALLLLPSALVLFGFLMDRAGFVPAVMVLVFGAAAAGREFRWVEVSLLSVVLALLSVAVFVWGLGLPYPLFTGH